MSLNIGRVNMGDIHYRYKRSKVELRYSGRGKNSKTAIVNLAKIAKQLKTEPGYISKFFETKFATVTGIDSKTKDWFLKGEHSFVDVNEKLEDFIDLYILCTHCNNPETSLGCHRDYVKMFCYACGKKGRVVDSSDKRGKFAKYLKKNPQDDSKMYSAYVRRKQSQKAITEEVQIEFPMMPKDEDEVVWSTDTSESAVQSRRSELSKVARTMVVDDL